MFIYILKSKKNGRHYIGLTTNLVRRFNEHNAGLVKKTKHFKPYKLIHVELVKNRNEARKLEKFFKSGYGREIIKEIEDSAPR